MCSRILRNALKKGPFPPVLFADTIAIQRRNPANPTLPHCSPPQRAPLRDVNVPKTGQTWQLEFRVQKGEKNKWKTNPLTPQNHFGHLRKRPDQATTSWAPYRCVCPQSVGVVFNPPAGLESRKDVPFVEESFARRRGSFRGGKSPQSRRISRRALLTKGEGNV